MTTCRDCHSWKDCPAPERGWYSYGEVRWCVYQVFWILKWEEYFDIGIWPTPESTVEAPKRTLSKDAQYVNSMIIIGELRVRLEKTGLKGKLLREECQNREKMLYLSDPAKEALWYCAGWRRKGMSFRDWLKQRKHRQYEHQKVVKVGLDK